jgi:hypothetical protein
MSDPLAHATAPRQPGVDLLPTFLVIGAAKSGTTALHHYLRQHPDVFLPASQEPSFFSFEGTRPDFRGPGGIAASVNTGAVTDLDAYRDLFRPAGGRAARGEVSPVYLYWPGTAERILAHVPDVKLCVILRNPVDRAFSAYMHAVREGKEPLEFPSALVAEPERIAQRWGFLWRYADLGHYTEQLRRFYDVFPASQIHVGLYDDLQRDPVGVCASVQRFIGVDDGFRPDVRVRHNVSGAPRSRAVQQLLSRKGPLRPLATGAAALVGRQRLRRWQVTLHNANLRTVEFPEDVRAELVDRFSAEIDELAGMIGKDLSHWKRT